VISSNLPCRDDGQPYSTASDILHDPGAAVYWYEPTSQLRRCIACDLWDRVRDNLHAIDLSLGAIRGISRWGASEMVQRAFVGFTALPPAKPWWAVELDVDPSADAETLKAAYHRRARQAHPDAGGDDAQMRRVGEAYAAAQEAR
jgi:hypothetical protein